MVVLPEGDRLMRVTLGSATETALEVQSDALGKLSLPLESACWDGSWWCRPVRDDLDAMWDRVRLEPRKEEVVWLSNGDRISGGFLGWDDRMLKMLVDGKPRGNRPHRDRGGRLRPGARQLSSAQVRIPGADIERRHAGSARAMPGSTKATSRRQPDSERRSAFP